jgi:transposase
LDAEVIARFAAAVRPEPRALPSADAQTLDELVTRRQQLIEIRTAEGNRRRLATGRLHEQLDEHLVWLDHQLRELDDELDHLLRSSPVWRQQADVLRSAKGVGPILTATLLSALPELATSIKVALVASMRKLLIILNAMARDGRRWQPAEIIA